VSNTSAKAEMQGPPRTDPVAAWKDNGQQAPFLFHQAHWRLFLTVFVAAYGCYD
jgi:hypothetical protein